MKSIALVAGVLTVLVAGSPAAAGETDAYVLEGNEHYPQARFVEAEALYEKAWSLKKAHDIAANLGYAEMRQGKTLEAVEHLSFAVRNWPPTGKEDKRQYAVERYLTLRKEVGAIGVEVNRAGAEIYVDGKRVGTSPLDGEVFVEAGTRVVEAKLAGFESARQSVTVGKGAAGAVKLELVPAAAAHGPGKSNGAGGAVDIAGAKGSGTGPASGGAGPENGAGSTDGAQGASAEGGLRKGLIIGGAATSAVLVGAGVVFAIVSGVKGSDAEEQRRAIDQKPGEPPCLKSSPDPECAAIESTLATQQTFSNLSVFSFVLGGVLGAGTAIYGLTTAGGTKRGQHVQAVPVLSARAGGLVVTGRW